MAASPARQTTALVPFIDPYAYLQNKYHAWEQSSRLRISGPGFTAFPIPAKRTTHTYEDTRQLGQKLTDILKKCRTHNCLIDRSYQVSHILRIDLSEKNIIGRSKDNTIIQMVAIQVTFSVARISKQGDLSWQQQWFFTHMTKKTSWTEEYVLPSWEVIPEREMPLEFFNGREVEKSIPDTESYICPSSFWDGWKKKDPKAALGYEQEVYVCMQRLFNRAALCLSRKNHIILEMGGGEGDFSFQIAPHPDIGTIFLFDSCRAAIDRAKRRVLHGKEEGREKVVPVECDIRKYNFTQLLGNQKADIIFLIGIAAAGVLSKQDSIALLMNCKKLLKRDGYIFVASYSSPHFSYPQYAKMGYRDLNRSFLLPTKSGHRILPAYALKLE